MSSTNVARRIGFSSSIICLLAAVVLLTTTLSLAQAPGLAWTTNIGAQAFAVDVQSNIFALHGGSVVRITAGGSVLETNAFCPIPAAYAQRDSAGSYYFTGSFDGTQNFGGITLVGGWSNGFSGFSWTPGYPTCFLAKYDANGILQWVTSFGKQAYVNKATDLMFLDDGSLVAAYANNQFDAIRNFSTSGSNRWQILIGDNDLTPPVGQIRVANAGGGNAFFLIEDPTSSNLRRGWFDTNGNSGFLSLPQIFWTGTGTNAKPAICDSTGAAFIGREISGGTLVISKYLKAGGVAWTMAFNFP
ncbi:MAG: hypothetical protein EPO07_08735 [Verrucomicrobia bacterium]|nr:MAG: hypothetical protein EPO07_08735 [Verrucomicrobiota bacterium]